MNVRTQTAVLMASALTQKDLTTVSVHTQWFWTQQKSDASDQQIRVVWSIIHITEVSTPLRGGADMATDPKSKLRLGHPWMSLLFWRILEGNAWTVVCCSRRHRDVGLHSAPLCLYRQDIAGSIVRLGSGWGVFSQFTSSASALSSLVGNEAQPACCLSMAGVWLQAKSQDSVLPK